MQPEGCLGPGCSAAPFPAAEVVLPSIHELAVGSVLCSCPTRSRSLLRLRVHLHHSKTTLTGTRLLSGVLGIQT